MYSTDKLEELFDKVRELPEYQESIALRTLLGDAEGELAELVDTQCNSCKDDIIPCQGDDCPDKCYVENCEKRQVGKPLNIGALQK